MPDALRILTAFVGLTIGVLPVAVEVGPSVVRVELVLNDTVVASIDGPPWSVPVEFGPSAAPVRLEARAMDDEGREIGRDVALLNRPFPRDGAAFEILSDRAGYPRRVRLLWESTVDLPPTWVRVALDGEILLEGIGTDVVLPLWDEARAHILTVELERADGGNDMAAAAFGGEVGCDPLWSLTPVVVQLPPGAGEPNEVDLEAALTARGEPVDVVAVRRESFRLWVVRDPEADRLIRWSIENLETMGGYWSRWAVSRGLEKQSAPEGSVLRYVAPQSTGPPGVQRFMVGPGLDISESALAWFVGVPLEEESSDTESINLAGAVTVAAREAAAIAAPRAVLLSLEREEQGEISYPDPHDVISQMEALGVHLEVWRHRSPRKKTRVWPTDNHVRGVNRLLWAAHTTLDRLDRQRVVWVRGEWLPSEFAMGENPAGLTIAGRDIENPGRPAP